MTEVATVALDQIRLNDYNPNSMGTERARARAREPELHGLYTKLLEPVEAVVEA